LQTNPHPLENSGSSTSGRAPGPKPVLPKAGFGDGNVEGYITGKIFSEKRVAVS